MCLLENGFWNLDLFEGNLSDIRQNLSVPSPLKKIWMKNEDLLVW